MLDSPQLETKRELESGANVVVCNEFFGVLENYNQQQNIWSGRTFITGESFTAFQDEIRLQKSKACNPP